MYRTIAVRVMILGAMVIGWAAWAADPAPAKAPETKPAKVEAPAPAKVEAAKPAADPLAFLPEIVARYAGDQTVTAAEIKKRMAASLAQAAAQGYQPTQEQILQGVNQTIQAVIGQRLLKAECAKEGYKPDVEAAKKRIDELETANGKERFEQQLQQQNLTREALVPLMADDLMIYRWINEKVKPGITVDDKAVEAFYNENIERFFKTPEQVSASHILIKVDKGATDAQKKEAKVKADGLIEKLKAGGDFAALAKENSDDTSKERGGDLGFFPRGQMVPAFEEVAFKLKPGEVSGVVETDFGFHIIKGGEHKTAGQVPLAEVKEKVRQALINQQLSPAMDKRVAQLLKDNKVEVLLPKPPEPPAPPAVDTEKQPEAAPAPAADKPAPDAKTPAK